MTFYTIQTPAGELVKAEPIVGRWYCSFETHNSNGEKHQQLRDGNLGQYVVYEGSMGQKSAGYFVDEEWENISMDGDYIVEQD